MRNELHAVGDLRLVARGAPTIFGAGTCWYADYSCKHAANGSTPEWRVRDEVLEGLHNQRRKGVKNAWLLFVAPVRSCPNELCPGPSVAVEADHGTYECHQADT